MEFPGNIEVDACLHIRLQHRNNSIKSCLLVGCTIAISNMVSIEYVLQFMYENADKNYGKVLNKMSIHDGIMGLHTLLA